MSWLSNKAERYLAGMGFIKASDISGLMQPVFAGESPANLPSANYTQEQLERLALTSAWVFSDIDVVTSKAASAKLQVYARDRERREPIEYHPFEQLMMRPNAHMGSSFLKKYTFTWMQLRGEAYWMLAPDSTGQLTEIWPLPSDRIVPIADARNYISGYMYRPTGGKQGKVIPAENICYFRYPNPFDYHRGLSKLSAYSGALRTDLKAAGWNNDTFDNDVTLKTMISVRPDVQRQVFQQIKHEIIEELVNQKKRYMVVRGGDIDVKTMGLSHKDMEFLAGREFTREEIDRVFGFPGGFWAKEATEANSKTALAILIELNIYPMLVLMQEEITAQVMRRYYGEDEEVEFDDIRPQNIEMQMKQESHEWESMTVNEVRVSQGKRPYNTPYGDVPWPLRDFASAIKLAYVETDSQAETALGVDSTQEKAVNVREIQRDLDRWRSIVKRQLKNGKSAYYDFDSQLIPIDEQLRIRAVLSWAETEKSIDNVFDGHLHTGKSLPELPENVSREITNYQNNIERLSAQAQNGEISQDEYTQKMKQLAAMIALIVFMAGSKKRQDQFTEDDKRELSHYDGLTTAAAIGIANDIFSGRYRDENRQSDMDGILSSRLSLWALTAAGVFAVGQLAGNTDDYLVWRRGATLAPCKTCIALDGVVRTAENWKKTPYRPQARNGSLECGGWNCDCRFEEHGGGESGDLP